MIAIDTSPWGEFVVTDLFEHIERGKGSGAGSFMNGDVPYIAASFANNGYVRGVADADGSLTSDGNCIAMIVNGNGGIGRNTYQAEPFVGSSDLQLGYHPHLNMYTGLFLVACLNKSIERYGYNFQWKRTGDAFAQETVFLPATTDGHPDWNYMQSTMERQIAAQERRLKVLKEAMSTKPRHLDISDWEEYRVGDLFDIHPTKAYKATNHQLMSEEGVNPVVVNSMLNNGIGGYTSFGTTEPGRMITFSDTTSSDAVFYQPEAFVGYPHVQGLYPIGLYSQKWDELSLLFFMTVFRKAARLRNFTYGNKFTRAIAAELRLPLPSTNTGEPDWEAMRAIMKTQLDRSSEVVERLTGLDITASIGGDPR